MTSEKAPARRRNAADSRQRLLDAARTLFAERGFDRTTIRDIGEQAGLDPTLIARYFGGKAALYLEALRTDFEAEDQASPSHLLASGRMTDLFDRIGRRGTGPIYDAALGRQSDPAVATEAREVLTHRLVDPTERHLRAGWPTGDSRLRAEIIAAAFVGVAVGRTSGAFPELTKIPSVELERLLTNALSELRVAPED